MELGGAKVQVQVGNRSIRVAHDWLARANSTALLNRVYSGRAILATCEDSPSPATEGVLEALASTWRHVDTFDPVWAAW